MKILIADNQDITCAGMMFVCDKLAETGYRRVDDKATLIEQLKANEETVVVLDYTLFDINDIDEFQIIHARFPATMWVMFSFELTNDFVKHALALGNNVSVLLKDSPLEEIEECVRHALNRRHYVCQRMIELLFAPQAQDAVEDARLTQTETEILKDIALGMTTREIAEKRFSSFHTVNTHRKNIFRKIGVNNVHEATKYALRAGLVDSAEYYI